MRGKAFLESRFIRSLILILVVCIAGLIFGSQVAEGENQLFLLLVGVFLLGRLLMASSEILFALLVISFQLRDLFPTFIKMGEIDVVITDVIYMLILFKAFIILCLKKGIPALDVSTSKFLLSLIIFVLVAIFSTIVISPLPGKSTQQAISLARFSTYLLLPFLIPILISNKRQVLFLANVIIYTSLFQVFISLTHRILINFGYDLVVLLGLHHEVYWRGELFSMSQGGIFRLTGTLADPAQLGFLLLTAFLLSVELSVLKYRYQGIRGKIMKAAPIILLCGLFLTQTRNSWVAFALALVSSLFLRESKLKEYFKPLIITVMVFLIINLLISTMVLPLRTTLETGSHRIAGWRIAWSIFLDNPFFGTGWGGYRFEAEKYYMAATHTLGSASKAFEFSQYSSSLGLYAQILSDLGLFGFGALLFLFYSSFKLIQRFTFRAQELELMCLSRGIILIFVAFCSFSVFDVTFFAGSNVAFLFFLLNGLIVALRGQSVSVVAGKIINQYHIVRAKKV